MKRRLFLALAPAVIAARADAALAYETASGALPSPAQVADLDPLVPLYHEWLDARRTWRELEIASRHLNFDTPEMLEAERRADALELEMLNLKPITMEGVGALVAVLWCYLDTSDDEDRPDCEQCHDVRALTAIWRGCTGQDGYPVI